MKILKVKAESGLELKGAMWGDNSMDSVVVMMSGICSNVFQNDLLPAAGELLSSLRGFMHRHWRKEVILLSLLILLIPVRAAENRETLLPLISIQRISAQQLIF